jgi:hypothetical protein
LTVEDVSYVTELAGVVTSAKKQFHPLEAVGNPITPVEASPPVPTFKRKAVAVPAVILGVVPKPELIVGVADEKAGLIKGLFICPASANDDSKQKTIAINFIISTPT